MNRSVQVARTNFRYRLVSAIALPLLLMVLLAGILFWQLNSLLSVTRWVEHTDQVITQANYTQKLLVDMETGIRGYMLSNEPVFLEPYQKANLLIDNAFSNLKNLVADNYLQGQRLKELQATYQQWQKYAAGMIAFKQKTGSYQLSAIKVRKQLMDRIRVQADNFIKTEESLRNIRSKKAQETTYIVLATCTGIAFLIGCILSVFSRHQIMAVAKSYSHTLKIVQAQLENLQDSEERFRFFVEGVRDYGIFMMDTRGYISSWNRGAERIKGYRAEEVLGQHFSLLFTPEDIATGLPEQELQIAVAEGEYKGEGWRKRKDGSLFFANVLLTALKDKAGNLKGFSKITRDITERQQAEQDLKDSEERFRATFEQASVGIAHVAIDGKWLMVNQKLCDIVGYTRTELVNLSFQDITYSEDIDADVEKIQQVLANKIQTYSMEKRYIRKDNSLIWTNLTVSLVREPTGEPKYFISVIEDISDRKRAELALRRAIERLATVHEIDLAILCARSAEMIIRYALLRLINLVPFLQISVAWFNFTKGEAQVLKVALNKDDDIEFSEVTTVGLENFIPITILSKLPTNYSDYLQEIERQPQFSELNPILKIDNGITFHLVSQGEIYGEFHLVPREVLEFSDEHRQIVYEIISQIAIAIQQLQLREQLELKAVELEQRVIERTAELQSANAELEAFAYSVSHDLRAPLRTMQGFCVALLEDYAEEIDPVALDYTLRISNAAQRMDTLIEDLLAYSRISRSELRLTAVDLNLVVTEALKRLESEIQGKQALITVAAPLPRVLGHHSTLALILTNLLGNAMKFVNRDVQPQVRVWAEIVFIEGSGEENQIQQLLVSSQHSPIAIPNPKSQIPDRTWVRLWVEDNGIGIEEEARDRIFQVFERLHGIESYPGTGIGLAIVRKGIERMGGRVGVESVVNVGSRFWVELVAN